VIENTFSNTALRLWDIAPKDGSSVGDSVRIRTRAVPRFCLGTVLAAGVFLSPATGDVQWPAPPVGGIAGRASVVGTSMCPPCCSLAGLADTAFARMSSERQSLYKQIQAIREGFGGTVDVNALVREMRENAG
jgi:hypothetical protein